METWEPFFQHLTHPLAALCGSLHFQPGVFDGCPVIGAIWIGPMPHVCCIFQEWCSQRGRHQAEAQGIGASPHGRSRTGSSKLGVLGLLPCCFKGRAQAALIPHMLTRGEATDEGCEECWCRCAGASCSSSISNPNIGAPEPHRQVRWII